MTVSRPIAFVGGLVLSASAYYALSADAVTKMDQSQILLQRINRTLGEATGASPDQRHPALTDKVQSTTTTTTDSSLPRIVTAYREEKQRFFGNVLPRAKHLWNSNLYQLAQDFETLQSNVDQWVWGKGGRA
ncbi:hypothetical protein IWQ62_004138 [Dispira parvispora]|uniref:Uncharacterized protein n=1 Tax=Dispira parvispora TaxID=1520584 RepID=A0A9W8E6F2_9FUNG|nr:hypothetical protein IWQ62_004138 [Dispira parvispora]